jgi:MFS family permease
VADASTRRAIAGGCALGGAVGWNVSNLGAVASSAAADYGVSLAMVGLFTTALFVVHALLQIPAGRAVDRLGARTIGLLALAVLAAANAVALVAAEPALALVARAAMGVGTALGFVAGSDYVRAHGGSSFAQGLYGGFALGTGGIALAVVPQAVDALAWRAPYVTALGAAAVGALVLAPGPRDAARAARAAAPALADAPGLLRDGRLYRICFLYMGSFGLSVVLGNWVVTLLEEAGGREQGVAGAVGSLVLLGGIVSRPFGGWAARRHPDRMRAIVAAAFAASAAGTVALAAAEPLALAAAGALVIGLASGIPFAPAFAAAARIRPDAPAAAVAMVNMAANLVIVAGTPLVGLSFSLPGDGRIGFAAAAALWIGAAVVVRSVRELDAHPRKPAPAAI